MFVVDSSSSIRLAAGGTNRYWEMQIDFIIRLIDRFEIGQSDVRIGVISFATQRTEVVVRKTICFLDFVFFVFVLQD